MLVGLMNGCFSYLLLTADDPVWYPTDMYRGQYTRYLRPDRRDAFGR